MHNLLMQFARLSSSRMVVPLLSSRCLAKGNRIFSGASQFRPNHFFGAFSASNNSGSPEGGGGGGTAPPTRPPLDPPPLKQNSASGIAVGTPSGHGHGYGARGAATDCTPPPPPNRPSWNPPPPSQSPPPHRPPRTPVPPKGLWPTVTGEGGMIRARISAFQILYKNFVRNLFGVFKDLCK